MCAVEKLMLSVIVPVYNVAPYLEDCINSLMDQGLSEDEYEIIFVDDGSTDDSLAILNKSAEEHSCMKVVYQENAGVSAARNKGLALAVGEYVAFVDGDDFLQTGALKALCDAGLSNDADTVQYDYLLVKEEQHYRQTQYSFAFAKNDTGNPLVSGFVCNQLVKRSVFAEHGISFPLGMKYSEDALVAFDIAMNIDANKQILTASKMYCYRQRSGSAIHMDNNKRTPQLIQDRFKLLDYYNDYKMRHEDLSIWKKQYIEKEMYVSSVNVILCALRCETGDPNQVLEQLRMRGLYPYPFRLDFLKEGLSLGTILRTLLCFPIVVRFFAKTKLLNNR